MLVGAVAMSQSKSSGCLLLANSHASADESHNFSRLRPNKVSVVQILTIVSFGWVVIVLAESAYIARFHVLNVGSCGRGRMLPNMSCEPVAGVITPCAYQGAGGERRKPRRCGFHDVFRVSQRPHAGSPKPAGKVAG